MNKFKRGIALLLSFLLVAAIALTGCGGNQTTGDDKSKDVGNQQKLKVAFVYVGPVGDAGWSHSHDQGRKYLEKEMPNVETTYVESVPEGADAERVLTELASKGNKIIFATSFGYMDPVIKVAQKFPDVVFMHATGFKTAPNVGTYFGREYQARYLSGIAAGKQTQTNVLGYVAAFPIPEVVRGINAFTLGVRSVNPNATVKVVWTNTWYNPATEKDAAKSLLDSGADVIAMHQDTPAPMQAAEEKGKFAVGYHTDMSSFAPKAVLTGPVWNWGPYYVKTVKAVMDKTWTNEQYWGPMADKIIDIAPFGPMVGDEAKALIMKKRDAIDKGEWDVFTGPIKDQLGTVRVAEGQKMTDQEMLSFDWFVQGVEGMISK
ncbi:BMP family ABC transporter substrate-binding protein [Heliophilum fasciatum]|uniref:Nucleoside-binding protein n=1 Tax=Heliophilum fasciatum TaxID=35700 RepID=A0A4R2RDV5_9FIRM|nr:BMP family ABC transporter substrate-binding protein [Heliophilum fasciatum]MCW2279194.1 basic membrane protein A [Heliophilum fasciatum]TCP60983.1 nucleoside-binding protein [Heliophilum fasciatum]